MTLRIDRREGSRDLVGPLRHHDIDVQLCELSSADVAFVGHGPPTCPVLRVGIELKHIGELIGALDTGRLVDTQYRRMIGHGGAPGDYDVSHLLIYGHMALGSETLHIGDKSGTRIAPAAGGKKRVDFTVLSSRLAMLSYAGLPHTFVPDIELAAAWVASQYRVVQKPWREHRTLWTMDTTTDTQLDKLRRRAEGSTIDLSCGLAPPVSLATWARAKVLARVPNLGADRAIKAIRHFGSVESAVNATEDEWCEVPGARIGPKIAAKVVGWLRATK